MTTKQTKQKVAKSPTALKSELQSARSKLGIERRKNRKLQSENAKLLLNQLEIFNEVADIVQLVFRKL